MSGQEKISLPLYNRIGEKAEKIRPGTPDHNAYRKMAEYRVLKTRIIFFRQNAEFF